MAKRMLDAVTAVEQAQITLATALRHNHPAGLPIRRGRGEGTRDDIVKEVDHDRDRVCFARDMATISFRIAERHTR